MSFSVAFYGYISSLCLSFTPITLHVQFVGIV